MRRLVTLAVLLPMAIMLGGCPDQTTTKGSLPTVPADIQKCFRESALPERAYTVADVEELWKDDRVRLVVMRQCGQRFLAWYGDLQKRWR